jgi:hypothetical protein
VCSNNGGNDDGGDGDGDGGGGGAVNQTGEEQLSAFAGTKYREFAKY